jgi:hypothetical protein
LCVPISLCADILRSYALLDEETQQRNIAAWRPTVAETLLGISGFPTDRFDHHVETFYPLAVSLLERDLGGSVNVELRGSVCTFLKRVGEVRFGLNMPMHERDGSRGGGGGSATGTSASTTPAMSPEVGKGNGGFDWERRKGSRAVKS